LQPDCNEGEPGISVIHALLPTDCSIVVV
jgi:hypothetical protein